MQLRPLSPNRGLHRTSHPVKLAFPVIPACQKTRLAFAGSEDIVWSYLVILFGSLYELCRNFEQTSTTHFAASITGHSSVTGKSKTCNLKAVAGNLLLEISCHRESCKT